MKPVYYVIALAVIAATLLLVAGPGARMDLWDFRGGFKLMRWAAFLGLGAAALATVMLMVPRTRRSAPVALVVALVVGLGVAYVPWSGMRAARALPPIHDITTDTRRPPEFVAVLPLRADAPNPAVYGGADIAKAQLEGYPDLRSRHLDVAPAEAFQRAETAARAMGWEIVAADAASNRIEATATTMWFGFKDDVVIRIEPDQADDGRGSRIDVRSVSRVGGSDVGANAARIRAFLRKLGD